MPQRVVVYYSCSLCGTESEGADKVTPWTLTGGGDVRGYDICAGCAATHEFFPAFLAAGIKERPAAKASVAKVTEAPPSNGSVRCDYCDESFTAQGMSLHLSKAHNVKARTTVKKEATGLGPHKCPECGFGARAPQGLAVHRRSVHGVPANPTGRKR